MFRSEITALLALVLAVDNANAETLLQAVQREHREEHQNLQTSPVYAGMRVSTALIDLNGDGRDEAIVHLRHAHCGTGGCGIEIFRRRGAGWRLMGRTSIGHLPVRYLGSRSNGWQDLTVLVAGGGIQPGYDARLRFDGRAYPHNPSVPPAERYVGNAGRGLISTEDQGQPLF